MQAHEKKHKLKNDILLIAAVVLIAAIATVAFFIFREEGAYAVVSINGEEYGRYPLSKDTVVDISTEYGYNQLTVSEGKARITDADCPDSICVHSLPISFDFDTISCRPHFLVVSIE